MMNKQKLKIYIIFLFFCRSKDIVIEVYSSDDDSQFEGNQIMNQPCVNTEYMYSVLTPVSYTHLTLPTKLEV